MSTVSSSTRRQVALAPATSSAPTLPSGPLSRGASGTAVKQVQSALVKLGYTPAPGPTPAPGKVTKPDSKWVSSANFSSRGGADIDAIVLHHTASNNRDVAPGRKVDPADNFDWGRIRRATDAVI